MHKIKRIHELPKLKREGSLINYLIPALLIGSVNYILDKKSHLYLRMLVRLVDKSFDEYEEARELLQEEIDSKNKLAYRFAIINHLENSVNAAHRMVLIFKIIIGDKKYGKLKKKKRDECLKIVGLISQDTINRIRMYEVSHLRNRIEHIDEDIYLDEFKSHLFLDVDNEYKKIIINEKEITIVNLVKIIQDYHNLVLEIFSNLPNRFENGTWYYDKN